MQVLIVTNKLLLKMKTLIFFAWTNMDAIKRKASRHHNERTKLKKHHNIRHLQHLERKKKKPKISAVFWESFLFFFFPSYPSSVPPAQRHATVPDERAPRSLYLKLITQHWQERILSFLSRSHTPFHPGLCGAADRRYCVPLSLAGYTKEDWRTGAITQAADKWTLPKKRQRICRIRQGAGHKTQHLSILTRRRFKMLWGRENKKTNTT